MGNCKNRRFWGLECSCAGDAGDGQELPEDFPSKRKEKDISYFFGEVSIEERIAFAKKIWGL